MSDRVDETVGTIRRNAIAYGIIAVLGGTAYVLALVATAIALSQRYGAITALFSLAGGFLVVAIIVFVVLAARNRRERELHRIRRRQLAARSEMMATASAFATRKPFAATGLALALGFLLAPKSRRRRDD